MIRVAVMEEHLGVLAALRRLLEHSPEPELELVAGARDSDDLWRALDRARADVVVLQHVLARPDALALCQQLKERVRPPAVVLYSAHAGPSLTVAAHLAGADAVVGKHRPVDELLEALSRVAAGHRMLPEVSADLRDAALARLADDDVPVATMLLGGASREDVGLALALDRREVACRARRIVARLEARAPGRTSAGTAA